MSGIGLARGTLIAFVFTTLYLLYAPNLLDIHPKPYQTQYLRHEGVLSFNRDLDRSELIAKDQVIAPDGLEHRDGHLYASLADGRIVVLKNDKVIKTLVNIPDLTKKESHPLGLRFHKQDLYIADGLQGLLKYDMKTGQLTTLLANIQRTDGTKLILADDLEIDEEGVIYLTDFTARWSLHDVFYGILEHAQDGRIITYNTKDGKHGVLLDHLQLPNGIQLSHDKNSLLFTETAERRISRYYLKGPKKGAKEVFSYLPGEPDNIRLSSRGGYWVALPLSSNATHPHAVDEWASSTKMRKILARLSSMMGTGLAFVNWFVSIPFLQYWQEQFQSGMVFLNIYNTKFSVIVELDSEGTIVRSLQSENPQFILLTHPLELDGYLYLGNFMHDYIVKVSL